MEFEPIEQGGVTSALGFKAAGVHAGFRHDPRRLDFALIEADQPCASAGVFTQNVFCAAPVLLSKAHLDNVGYSTSRAIMINSGIANAATGKTGYEIACRSAEIVSEAVGCPVEEMLVASTGIIGQNLDLQPFRTSAASLHASVSVSGGSDAARAIMTTDTVSKEYALSYISADPDFAGMQVRVGGMVKGSGMIMPNMATMIAVVTTDAPVRGADAHAALQKAAAQSFNKVTVDSDTSTNDTCFLMASGLARPEGAPEAITPGSSAYDEFCTALTQVCTQLARKIAADGEGATCLVEVTVQAAANNDDADKAARAIANSPLVKTAIFGHDANWGRIAAAAGKSGAAFKQENVDIDILGIPVLRSGLPVAFDEDEALRRFEASEVPIRVSLGAGNASATIWTCDFSHEYVSINGDYRS